MEGNKCLQPRWRGTDCAMIKPGSGWPRWIHRGLRAAQGVLTMSPSVAAKRVFNIKKTHIKTQECWGHAMQSKENPAGLQLASPKPTPTRVCKAFVNLSLKILSNNDKCTLLCLHWRASAWRWCAVIGQMCIRLCLLGYTPTHLHWALLCCASRAPVHRIIWPATQRWSGRQGGFQRRLSHSSSSSRVMTTSSCV